MKNKILFVTNFYYPNNTGSSVIMTNLIKELDEKLVYGVVTSANSFFDKQEVIDGIKIHKIFNFQHLFFFRFWFYVRRFIFHFALKKIIKLIKTEKITHVVGVYPDLDFLELARTASVATKTKFYPYLHDTIIEGLSHTKYKHLSKEVQKKVFQSSEKIFVMSEGMKYLYENKYNLKTIPLLHSFSEKIKQDYTINGLENSIFWGGNIYSINKESVKRIHSVCQKLGYNLTLTASNSIKKLKLLGFENININILPFLTRKAYLSKLRSQNALLLSIDSANESLVHNDELKTIFPTKTIEYLLSGRPILVHCPEDYFLAKFFKKYKCGIVISETNINTIEKEITNALADKKRLNEMILNAYKTAQMFDVKNVKSVFEATLDLY